MTAQKPFTTNVSTDLTDILFERRNKAYGAYNLRKHYDERVNKSMLITMSIFLLFFLLATVITSHQKPDITLDATPRSIVDLGKTFKLPPPNAPQKRATVLPSKPAAPKTIPDKTNIKLVSQVTPPPTKPDSVIIKTTNPVTIGTPITVLTSSTPTTPSGSDNAPATAPKDAANYADVMPSFPGGQPALEKYLKKHLQFTPAANDASAEGKVFISFVIDVDGSVEDVKLVKDKMGYGCAQNAMDVIENMPSWIPGSTNGHTLAVRVILPIDFKK